MSARHEPHSLYWAARNEAEKLRWIESEKRGRDMGDETVRDWYRRNWRQYCRHRHLEHLTGACRWQEFDAADFGNLYSLIVDGDLLLDRILDRVCDGQENLDIIQWAFAWGLPQRRVLGILTQLNVNRARLEPDTD